MSVKNKLIKLAYENPELRGELLPVIMKMGVEGLEPHDPQIAAAEKAIKRSTDSLYSTVKDLRNTISTTAKFQEGFASTPWNVVLNMTPEQATGPRGEVLADIGQKVNAMTGNLVNVIHQAGMMSQYVLDQKKKAQMAGTPDPDGWYAAMDFHFRKIEHALSKWDDASRDLKTVADLAKWLKAFPDSLTY